MPGKSLFLSGLFFCDLFLENFRVRTSVSWSRFVLCMFWCFLAIVSAHIFLAFLPEMPGKNSLVVRSGFLRPFSGKFSGANFCFKVSICALHVLVPSSHCFWTFFCFFSRECFFLSGVWFYATISGTFSISSVLSSVLSSVFCLRLRALMYPFLSLVIVVGRPLSSCWGQVYPGGPIKGLYPDLSLSLSLDSFPESSRTSLSSVWFVRTTDGLR